MNLAKKLFSFLALSLVLFFPLVSLGQTGSGGNYLPIVQCGVGTGKDCTICEFFKSIERIVKFVLFQITPPLAALMIVIGGAMMIIAYAEGGGGPALISKAQKLLGAVAIGLIIIYGAWVIVNTFFALIGVSSWTGLQNGWWNIQCN